MSEIIADKIPSPAQRLSDIIDAAYSTLCHQVAGGVISIENEASMQLHLSNILLQLGNMNVLKDSELFKIALEQKIKLTVPTSKSKNQVARADIWLELKDSADPAVGAQAVIELKKLDTIAVTDGRYSILEDLQNLEEYKHCIPNENLIIREIIYTPNANYMKANANIKFSLGNHCTLASYDNANDTAYPQIALEYRYPILWRHFVSDGQRHCFLILKPEK